MRGPLHTMKCVGFALGVGGCNKLVLSDVGISCLYSSITEDVQFFGL